MTHLAPMELPSRRLIVVLLLAAGIALRLLHGDERGSDVIATTHAAIDLALAGDNPYGHGYAISRPPGAPFAYGPLALVWYALMPQNVELLASIAVLLLLAATGRLIGLAVCALWVPLAIFANDGSNDTSASLLLLGALVTAERSPRIGAAALALVVAFKPYALAFLPPLVAFAGPAVIAPFVAISIAAWAPAIGLWGADSILGSFRLAMEIHQQPWYSPAAMLKLPPSARPALSLIQLGLGAAATVASFIWVRSARSMIAWGFVIFALTLFTGWWATVAYWAAIAPIAAWHVDAWYRDLRSSASPSAVGLLSVGGNRSGGRGVRAA